MPKKLIHDLYDPSDIYPDPLGRAKGMAIYHSLADVAIADTEAATATRLFANIAGDATRDIRLEATAERMRLKRERETEAETDGEIQA